ncbi:hypothetical protein BC828DRAFT_298157 [Blastocladiella britannica]|nr:hypothetical protein BC828DRAFT_298157 [Blastocladiella britannica]
MLTPFSLRTICYGPCGAHASLGLDATQTVDPLQAVIENLIGDALAVPATAMAHVILHDREQQCTLDFVTRHAVGDRQVRLLSLHLRAACHKEKRQEMIAQCISTRTQLQQVYAQTNELVRVIGIRAPMLLAATNGFAPTDRVPTRQPGPPVASKWARLTLDALRSSAAHDEQSSERGSSSSGPAPVQERGTDMHSAHNIANRVLLLLRGDGLINRSGVQNYHHRSTQPRPAPSERAHHALPMENATRQPLDRSKRHWVFGRRSTWRRSWTLGSVLHVVRCIPIGDRANGSGLKRNPGAASDSGRKVRRDGSSPWARFRVGRVRKSQGSDGRSAPDWGHVWSTK